MQINDNVQVNRDVFARFDEVLEAWRFSESGYRLPAGTRGIILEIDGELARIEVNMYGCLRRPFVLPMKDLRPS